MNNYPTRVSSTFNIVNRLEAINPAFSQFYADNGYLLIPDFLPNTSELKSECENIYNGVSEVYRNNEPGSDKMRSALAIHRLGPFSSLASMIAPIAKSILSEDVYMHQSRINFKAGRDANGWNWHSDFETWHSKDGMPGMNCLTAMVAIDDNSLSNGCLYVLPKSHSVFVSCPKIGDVNPENEFSEQTEGVPSDEVIKELCDRLGVMPTAIECKKGDLLLFDCNTLHYSGANNTDDKRTNVYFVFNAVSNALVSPSRPEAMGSTKIEIL